VDAGVVYGTDALASERVRTAFRLPEGSHDPVIYLGALLAAAPRANAGQAFLTYVSGGAAREVFRRRGFEGT
jgi:molybdate transport system substrate-binding protein